MLLPCEHIFFFFYFRSMGLTKDQKLVLAKEVLIRKKVLFGKFSPTITRKLRNAAWEDIRQKLLDMGATVENTEVLRDNDWGNLRRCVVQKFTKSMKSGEGGSELTELDNIVLDTIGRESSNVKALAVQDIVPNFTKSAFGESTSENLLELNGTYVPLNDLQFEMETSHSTGKV